MIVWVSKGRISSFWICYNPFTADLAMSQRDIKNPYFAFCAKFFLIHNPVYCDIICLPGKC